MGHFENGRARAEAELGPKLARLGNAGMSSTFGQLSVGDSFDFIDDSNPGRNSFFERCVKTGPRTYKGEGGQEYKVGSTGAKVFHVSKK